MDKDDLISRPQLPPLHFECNFGVDRDDTIFKEFNIL